MTNSNNTNEYEEGAAGTNKDRKIDPLKEWESKEPMTPAKLNTGEPTAVKYDSEYQKIAEGGNTGTNTPEAEEQYRKRGMTKVETSE